MSAVEHEFLNSDVHPIDIVESLAEQSDWDFDRVGTDQIAMAIEGAWRTYSLSLSWSGYDDILRMVCTFEIKPPVDRLGEFHRLINLANDKIWGGNFTLWPEQGMLAFRYGLTLAGGAAATPEQVEAMVLTAVGMCERFYPAYQLCAWGDETAEQALRVAIDQAYGTC